MSTVIVFTVLYFLLKKTKLLYFFILSEFNVAAYTMSWHRKTAYVDFFETMLIQSGLLTSLDF